uniref:Uncharacterized protein n=1 Tax=Arundo donax TaxID=35708 RepID=A0A0A9FPP0_ARUDO
MRKPSFRETVFLWKLT